MRIRYTALAALLALCSCARQEAPPVPAAAPAPAAETQAAAPPTAATPPAAEARSPQSETEQATASQESGAMLRWRRLRALPPPLRSQEASGRQV